MSNYSAALLLLAFICLAAAHLLLVRKALLKAAAVNSETRGYLELIQLSLQRANNHLDLAWAKAEVAKKLTEDALDTLELLAEDLKEDEDRPWDN